MIIRISGGIGNQMFQYAFKQQLDYIANCKNTIDIRFFENRNVHNGYELNKVFDIDDETYDGSIKAPSEVHPIIYRGLYRIGKRFYVTKKYAMEVLIDYYEKYKSFSGEKYYLDGYWQSEEYFKDVKDEVRESFIFPQFCEESNINLCKRICQENAIALHVRRGDFLESSKFVCLGKTDYYQQAIKYISDKVNSPIFVVLSDDIDWCRNNLHLNEGSIYVDWNKNDKSFRDMQIMSICSHCIIANSSFSWWGAWLNKNPDKIIVAPYKFYKGNTRNEEHLIPKEWIKIQYAEV